MKPSPYQFSFKTSIRTKQQFTNRLLIVLGSLTCLCATAAEPARRPNVLFIISDDLSSRITPAGYAGRQTAVLDRLAAEAVTFRSVFQEHFGVLPGEYASKAHAGGIRQE